MSRARQVRLVAMLLAALLAAPGPAVAEAGFLAEYEDLPLAPGLEQAGGGLVFETAGGRIVEAYATGSAAPAEVLAFYAETLPQLGWERTGETRFRREGEELRLDFSQADGQLTVRFAVTPAEGK